MKYKLRVQNPEIVEAYPTQYYVATLEKKMSAEEFDKLYEPISEPEQTYIIEFRYKKTNSNDWNGWSRSGNRGASGEFTSLEEARLKAKENQEEMSDNTFDYEYRVIPYDRV